MPDGGPLAAAACSDGAVRLWRLSQGSRGLQPHAICQAHSAGMGSSCAWSPDGTKLASSATDGSLILQVDPSPLSHSLLKPRRSKTFVLIRCLSREWNIGPRLLLYFCLNQKHVAGSSLLSASVGHQNDGESLLGGAAQDLCIQLSVPAPITTHPCNLRQRA